MIAPIAVTGLTIFYAGWTAAALVAVLFAVLLVRARASVEAPPVSWGQDPDDLEWESEAATQLHGSLAAVRATAKSWGETITALLGVFSAVAFIKGPDAFTDIHGDRATVAALLIMLAAGLAALSIALAAFAAQGVPRTVIPFDGWALKALTLQRARTAATQLAWSRVSAVAALLLVVFAVGLTWLTALQQTGESNSAQHALVVPRGGRPALCGTLGSSNGALTLTPEGQAAKVITDAASVTIVKACP